MKAFDRYIKYLVIVLLFVNTSLHAQLDSNRVSHNKHHLLVGLSLIGANTVSFQHQGVELLTSKFRPSAEIHLGYELDFEHRGQFVTRLSAGMLPQTFRYDIVPVSGSPILLGSMAENNATISHVHKGYWDGFYISIAPGYVGNLLLNRKHHFQIGLALRLSSYVHKYTSTERFYTADVDEGNSLTILRFLEHDQSFQSNLRMGFDIDVTHSFHVGKSTTRIIRLSFVGHISPWLIERGSYSFSNIGIQSYGTYRIRNSFVGLRVEVPISLIRLKPIKNVN